MNPKLINLICFVVGCVVGFGTDFVLGGISLGLAGFFAAGGCALLIFGAPHRYVQVGYAGWTALGLALGVVAPFLLLLMFYAR